MDRNFSLKNASILWHQQRDFNNKAKIELIFAWEIQSWTRSEPKKVKDSASSFLLLQEYLILVDTYNLGGVKSAFKDPTFGQSRVIQKRPFQTLNYMFYNLPLQTHKIECTFDTP